MTKNTYMTESKTATLIKFINKSELDKHFLLKTGDRAPNKDHCRAVCDMAIEAYNGDREGFVQLAKELSFPSPARMMMAATGRPFKDRKSGKNVGGQALADEVANCVLTELAFFLHKPRPDVKYSNCGDGLVAQQKFGSKKLKPAPRVAAKKVARTTATK